MRAIKVRFDGKVFVPEEVELSPGSEGLVVVKEDMKKAKSEWKPPGPKERERYRRELQAYIEKHLPGLDLKVPDWLVNMVGIAPPMMDEEIKEMYYMHFLETDE